MSLEEEINKVRSILEIELNEYKVLSGDELNKLRSLLSLTSTDKIYYNSTNLILTDQEDITILKSKIKKFEEILKIEIIEFNTFIYIGRYINSKELKEIIPTWKEEIINE